MRSRKFVAFAWFFVLYLLAVILFGAWVRITGSGNGCGSHWPACNGEIIPQAPEMKTLIEYTHRLMTGLCGIFAVVLVFWSRRMSGPIFRASLMALCFLIVEALLGAVLVKRHLVVDDASVERAYAVELHLANTLLLTASAALVAWRASLRHDEATFVPPAAPIARILLGFALLVVLLTSVTGAVTALGDTVFPTQPALDGTLLAKIQADTSPSQHFLVRLRVIHPAIAAIAALLVAGVLVATIARRGNEGTARMQLAVFALCAVVCQTGVGIFNVLLAAPAWIQIVHLLLAQSVWIFTWLVFLASASKPYVRRSW